MTNNQEYENSLSNQKTNNNKKNNQSFIEHLKSFTAFEIIFTISCIFIIWFLTLISLIFSENVVYWLLVLSLFAAGFGIIANISATKKTKWNYFWGVFHVLLYALVSYFSAYFGDAILNLFYYFPLMIIGFFMWKSNEIKEGDNGEVKNKKLSIMQWTVFNIFALFFYFSYSFLLKFLGGVHIYLDSASTTLSLYGMLLMNYRYREQWIIWFFVNFVSAIMWLLLFVGIDQDPTSSGINVVALPMFLMWVVYLSISILGWKRWQKT
ncbi:MAG: hypothetical protein GQ557_00260 [Mycoplasmataceae bacterium]|nr:hypothetical protein [Mycoplasmataceae bacterium]